MKLRVMTLSLVFNASGSYATLSDGDPAVAPIVRSPAAAVSRVSSSSHGVLRPLVKRQGVHKWEQLCSGR